MTTALVVLSSGIGNVIRWTPIIRVLHAQGYTVDVWLSDPDYPDVASLLLGAPEIRDVVLRSPIERHYDVAVLSHWARTVKIHANRVWTATTEAWRQLGDSRTVEEIARDLGFLGDMPAPIAMPSDQSFGFTPDWVAFHPGSKALWAWKRWPWFRELAGHFRNIVVVGSAGDEDPRDWRAPRGITGQLVNMIGVPLADTAKILAECGALVCNDSGLSHVAAAVGTPTFPIYGITKAKREAMPLANVFPIENRKWCRPGCELLRGSEGRCSGFGEYQSTGIAGPACLVHLTADDVAQRVKTTLPHL